jgi:hypothetical protein
MLLNVPLLIYIDILIIIRAKKFIQAMEFNSYLIRNCTLAIMKFLDDYSIKKSLSFNYKG